MYHDAVAGASGEVDVVPVRGDVLIPSRDVVSNVPANTIHSLAGAVGAWIEKTNELQQLTKFSSFLHLYTSSFIYFIIFIQNLKKKKKAGPP